MIDEDYIAGGNISTIQQVLTRGVLGANSFADTYTIDNVWGDPLVVSGSMSEGSLPQK